MQTTASNVPAIDAPPRSRAFDWIVAAVPVALVLAMLAIYLAAPDFYLRYILEYRTREGQVAEVITTLSSLIAGLALLPLAIRQWKVSRREPGASRLPGGAFFMLLIALAAIFMAGEESSWGQTYFGWETPESYKRHSGETNLHNADLPISLHSLGSLFLIVMFIVLPLLWSQRSRLPVLPRDWEPAIAEWPVVFCFVFAFLWKLPKDLYRAAVDDGEHKRFYVEYLDQLNEQKEMLVAIGLLMYACYRFAAMRRERAAKEVPHAQVV